MDSGGSFQNFPECGAHITCMNNKMSDNETQSITAWEKTHAAERKACDAEAGWK